LGGNYVKTIPAGQQLFQTPGLPVIGGEPDVAGISRGKGCPDACSITSSLADNPEPPWTTIVLTPFGLLLYYKNHKGFQMPCSLSNEEPA